MNCRCCSGPGPFREFEAREMMFGWRHRFVYLECAACGSLQIRDIPERLGDYYPAEYYSLHLPPALSHEPSRMRALAAWLLTLPGGAPLTRRLRERYPFLHWARLGGIRLRDAVLDIGCGAGVLLRRMRRWGYRNLTGIDPYLAEGLTEPGLTLRRAELGAFRGEFDLVMLHHVLEHLPDPTEALRQAKLLLRPGGRMLVRLPLAATPLAREFGTDWFNLDAPRHLVIPSRAGITRLVAAAGLRLRHEECDSTPLSIFYSECYRRDVPMREAPAPHTTPEQERGRPWIEKMDAAGLGDYAVFVLEPARDPAPAGGAAGAIAALRAGPACL